MKSGGLAAVALQPPLRYGGLMNEETKQRLRDRWLASIADQRDVLESWRRFGFRFSTNGVDDTDKFLADAEEKIATLERLVEALDGPDA